LADARSGVQANPTLQSEEINGTTHWMADLVKAPDGPALRAFLMPTYDEFLVGYTTFTSDNRYAGEPLRFNSTVIFNGQIVGSWQRTLKSQHLQVELALFANLSPLEQEQIHHAAIRYGAFHRQEVIIV
jgi:hypothetical protein